MENTSDALQYLWSEWSPVLRHGFNSSMALIIICDGESTRLTGALHLSQFLY